MNKNVVTPDTLRFLRLLFAPYAEYPSARVELRTFAPEHQKGSGRPPRSWHPLTDVGLARAAENAIAWGERWDVYFGVLPRRQGGGRADDLRICSWLWCDVDGGDEGPAEALAVLKGAVDAGRVPKPHLVNVSGGGCHAYWRLATPVPCRTRDDQEQIRRTLRRLVLAVGGTAPAAHADRASAEPARILRLPGTFNHKIPDRARSVRLLRADETAPALPLVWWRANLPAEPLPPSYRRPMPARWKAYGGRDGGSGNLSLFPATVAKIQGGAPHGRRHYVMVEVAVAARKQGADEAEIRAAADQVGRASGVPMDDYAQQRHLDEIVRWTMESVLPDPTSPAYGRV